MPPRRTVPRPPAVGGAWAGEGDLAEARLRGEVGGLSRQPRCCSWNCRRRQRRSQRGRAGALLREIGSLYGRWPHGAALPRRSMALAEREEARRAAPRLRAAPSLAAQLDGGGAGPVRPARRRGSMAVAVLRPLEAPPAELAPVTALLLAPPPLCAALRGRGSGGGSGGGGGLVLAVRPAGRGGAQAVLLSAVALEAGGRRGAELWLRWALMRRLGLAAGRRVAVWPVRRPPPLAWVLLGAAGRAGRPAGGAVLVRRGEALPGPGPGPGPLVLEARPALQGLLGNGTRTALAPPPPPPPPREPVAGSAPCRLRPSAPPLVSRFAAAGPGGEAEALGLRAAPPGGSGAGGGGAEVWVSRRGLLALGLFQGEWVRVGVEGAARQHLAALLARPPPWEYPRAARRGPPDGAALLSPALAFNLGCDPAAVAHLRLRVRRGRGETERPLGPVGVVVRGGRGSHDVPFPLCRGTRDRAPRTGRAAGLCCPCPPLPRSCT